MSSSLLPLKGNNFSFAFIGSGPGSLFLAKNILHRLKSNCLLHFYEKEIYPYGLLRTGVAPDHPQFKQLQSSFDHILSSSNSRFFGNTPIGKHLSLKDLSTHYSAVIFGNGAQTSNKLNLPNEDAPFIYDSKQVANWYNGAVDTVGLQFSRQSSSCVIIGNGNVAIDIARILSKPIDDLKGYAFPGKVLEQLKRLSQSIKDIYIVARRGFEFSSFTTDQIRELSRVKGVKIFCDRFDDGRIIQKQPQLKRKLSVVKAFNPIDDPLKLKPNRRNIALLFNYIPIQILKGAAPAITFSHALTNSVLTIKAGVIIKSLGFKNDFIFSKDVPYEHNHMKHKEGYVTTHDNSLKCKCYSVGWNKDGPKGTLQNTFIDSKETFESILLDIHERVIKPCSPNLSLLISHSPHRAISFKEWTVISNYEIAKGKALNKPREPITSKQEMLALI